MASSVFYKFKSQKDESRVTFDGTGISVFDLKKEIILANNLGKANDFDLAIFDRSSNEEYKDDSTIIPRASSVIVKRVFVRPGKGKAAMYLSGTGTSSTGAPDQGGTKSGGGAGSHSWHRGNMSKRFDGRDRDEHSNAQSSKPAPTPVKTSITQDEEAAAMAAMFQAQTANWEETQEKMSQLVSSLWDFLVLVVVSSSNELDFLLGSRGAHHQHRQPDRPLPPSYVCYRCGQKGHWIQDCPTNNDRDYDNRPRIKRTTGIPRSFLKAIENPDAGKIGHGVMVTPEGGYVVAQPDSGTWHKQLSRHKALTEAEVREKTPTDSSLACPIDNKLFRDAVKTPCCGTIYCEECIQTHLLERDFKCPNCGVKVASLDKLIADKPSRTKVGEYIAKEIEKSKHEGSGPAEEEKKADGVDQEYYSDQQPGGEMDTLQMVADSIPHIQAQIQQVTIMLNNPSLPLQVRQQTEMKHAQLQMELQQAQMAAALIQAGTAAAAYNMNNMNPMNMPPQQPQMPYGVGAGGMGMQMPGPGAPAMQQQQGNWTNPFSNQQPAGQDSAYQRLPLNNRRRNMKRERPSDFLEVAGEAHDAKVPRYWE
ncbi:DWNN-domain-containing protein [Panus rudis PR-1116 ss-1]|nr:DWNN-domain-containing protein [Panus rudis PR-1116 ss-1]